MSKPWKEIEKNLISGGRADIGDTAYLNDGRFGRVVDIAWMQMVFGRIRNCGTCTIEFPDGHKEQINVSEFRVPTDYRRI